MKAPLWVVAVSYVVAVTVLFWVVWRDATEADRRERALHDANEDER